MTGKQSAVFFAFVILGMGCFYYLMIEPGRRAERLRQAIRQGASVEDVESLLTGRYFSYYRVKTADGWERLSRSEFTKAIGSESIEAMRLRIIFMGISPYRVIIEVEFDHAGNVTNVAEPSVWWA
jgi:hypothetical protein